MPVLRPDELDKVNLDYESVQAAGSLLGSGGVIVMDDTTCMVRAAWNLAGFSPTSPVANVVPAAKGVTGWKRSSTASSKAKDERAIWS